MVKKPLTFVSGSILLGDLTFIAARARTHYKIAITANTAPKIVMTYMPISIAGLYL
jgi:hypothetical protein